MDYKEHFQKFFEYQSKETRFSVLKKREFICSQIFNVHPSTDEGEKVLCKLLLTYCKHVNSGNLYNFRSKYDSYFTFLQNILFFTTNSYHGTSFAHWDSHKNGYFILDIEGYLNCFIKITEAEEFKKYIDDLIEWSEMEIKLVEDNE